MSKVLYIKANPKNEEDSFSLSVGRMFIEEYKQNNPQDEVVEFDVYSHEITFLDKDVLSSWQKLRSGNSFEDLTDIQKQKNIEINNLVDYFIGFDKYVIASPVWNFGLPPYLKAFVDNILIAGKTFKYTEKGPVGLLNGKKLLHVQASGGVYADSPMDFSNKYIKSVFKFIGVEDVDSILIQGTNMFVDKLDEIKQNALLQAKEKALKF